jgi:hypothetical protein
MSPLIKCLERWSARIWPITLLISVLILAVAATNLSILIGSNRPELVSMQPILYVSAAANPPEFVRLAWTNVGKRSAHRGTAILYTVSKDGARLEKLGAGNIGNLSLNQSTPIPPTTNGSTTITVDMGKFVDLFLACVTYYDESDNRYPQSFLYKRGVLAIDNVTTSLEEIRPAGKTQCKPD